MRAIGKKSESFLLLALFFFAIAAAAAALLPPRHTPAICVVLILEWVGRSFVRC